MKPNPRDLTAEELSEAQAHAYAAHWLTGRGAVEVLDRMKDVIGDALNAAQRGDLDRARHLTLSARAGLDMVRESLVATGMQVVVATSSPLVSGGGKGGAA